MGKLKIEGYELRDVAVMQAPVSFCNHRGEVNPFINVCNREVYPVFVSPMASVTNEKNYKGWIDNKLTPVVPRSVQKSDENPNGLSFEERMEIAKETFVSVSLGEAQKEVQEYLLEQSKYLAENPDCGLYPGETYYICIDIAHGTLSELYDVCKRIKVIWGKQVVIMTGNIANPSSYAFYADAGIDYMRVGVGGGCFTPDMCVITKNGLKKICEIQIGDEVLTHTGEFHKVTHVHEYQRIEKLVRVNNIECTKNHLFYVVNKNDREKITEDNIQEYAYWVPASELDKKKHLLVKK